MQSFKASSETGAARYRATGGRLLARGQRWLAQGFTLLLALGLAVAGPLPLTSAAASKSLRDIDGHWAEAAIQELVKAGVVGGYPDRTFKPERTVSRAEMARWLMTAFEVPPGRSAPLVDVKGHWARPYIESVVAAGLMKGYPDGSFRPDRKLTEAEAIVTVLRAVRLADVKGYPDPNAPSPVPELNRNHWAYGPIAIAIQLDLLPPPYRESLKPDRAATRAEAVSLIAAARHLVNVRGTVESVDTTTGVVTVKGSDGTLHTFSPGATTLLIRNTVLAPDPLGLLVGDQVLVTANQAGLPLLMQASGVVTRQDVIGKVSTMTRGLLTPADLQAIVTGNWAAVGDSLKASLYDQLLARGATPLEAEAILQRDWTSLGQLARERLAQAMADRFGISLSLAQAVLSQDWRQAAKLAQLEAAQQLLNLYLFGQGAAPGA